MRIAHFTNTYIPTISGVVRNIINLQRTLTERGNQVFIFTENAAGRWHSNERIFCYPTFSLRLPMDFPAIIPFSPSINKRIPQLQLDIIHAHHPFSLGRVALAKARWLKIPVVFTFHTLYWEHAHYVPVPSSHLHFIVRKFIEKRVGDFMRRCDCIIVYTECLRRLLISKYGLEDKIAVVPTAIDLAPFQQLNREKIRSQLGWNDVLVLISVGRLGLEKNWITFLDAGIRTMHIHSSLRIVIIGDGPERGRLQQFVHDRGASKQVIFLGKIPFEQVPKYLKAADLYGFASVTETIGRATIEALAAGLPVVAVNANGTKDIVDHDRQGLLTENEPGALAAAMDRILSNEALRERYRAASQRKAGRFNLDQEASRILATYARVINDG